MKFFSAWSTKAATLGVILIGGCSLSALAFDTHHTLHHPAKASEQRTSASHQAAHRPASDHAAAKTAATKSSHAKSASAATKKSTAKASAGNRPAAKSRGKSPRLAARDADRAEVTSPRGKAALRKVSFGRRRGHKTLERFTASSFADGSILEGDILAGEDPVVRQAAIDALAGMNGTAVVIDPSNGRILAMVNQKLALSPGAEPCSTIKLTVAMAALSEGLVNRDTPVQLDGFHMNMTDALAKSNNLYFEELGRQLGFDRVQHYAHQFGLGELAGYNIDGEQLGTYPAEEIPAAQGGVARMCSFGQGISMTPLQLGAYVAALANGGTLYYLQHPTTPEQAAAFEPRIKRTLNIAKFVPEMLDGMAGAVQYGTARSLRASFNELPVFGKTGTCSDHGTRFGWFASFSQSQQGGLVTVFFLEGGRPTFGPRAAELTGVFYRNLWDHNYFQQKGQQPVTASAANTGSVQP